MESVSRTQVVAVALATLVVVALGVRWVHEQAPAGSSAVRPVAGAGTGAPAEATGEVSVERAPREPALVHVAGAVRHPGVYRLSAGARVRDAVRSAGGAAASGDVNAINLAAKVVDGQQVVVPRRAPVPGAASAGPAPGGAPAAGGSAAAAPAGPVSLSSATVEQLDTLDGVGPATAEKIVAYRQEHGGFRSVDELAQVPGIGPKKLASLKGQLQP